MLWPQVVSDPYTALKIGRSVGDRKSPGCRTVMSRVLLKRKVYCGTPDRVGPFI